MEYNSYNLIVVDIQSEYRKYFGFSVYDFLQLINDNEFKSIHWLFNGPYMEMSGELELQQWLLDYGLDEDKLIDIHFYDKGYADFKTPMDRSINDKHIINLIKFLIVNRIDDAKDMDKEFWDLFYKQYGSAYDDLKLLKQNTENLVTLPELLDYVKNKISGNSILVGGKLNEGIKEVELCFRLLGKTYKRDNKWIY